MSSSFTVVVLHAHPDDEAIFTGLTMRRLADAGVRVVLVTATGGEEGEPRIRLSPGETLGARRLAELERSCDLLGVQRLVPLGYRDSGAGGGPWPAGSLGAAPIGQPVEDLARVVEQESASALIHYDPQGMYGHVDHVRVHRMGAEVARRTGIAAYETTVDDAVLRRGPRHLLHVAAGDDRPLGVPGDQISLTVRASGSDLLTKMAAMCAHASQIGPEFLDGASFLRTYGQEWFVRRGALGPVDVVLAGSPAARNGTGANLEAAVSHRSELVAAGAR